MQNYRLIRPLEKSIEVYILSDGKYELDDVYTDFSEADWSRLNEKEKAEQSLTLKLSLYDDLEISVQDIFAE